MTEEESRGATLQWYYDERSEGLLPKNVGDLPPGVSHRDFMRISAELCAARLIDWTVYPGMNGMEDTGLGEITSFGIAVMEGRESSPYADTAILPQRQGPVSLFAEKEQLLASLEALAVLIERSDLTASAKIEAKLRIRDLLRAEAVAPLLEGDEELLLALLAT